MAFRFLVLHWSPPYQGYIFSVLPAAWSYGPLMCFVFGDEICRRRFWSVTSQLPERSPRECRSTHRCFWGRAPCLIWGRPPGAVVIGRRLSGSRHRPQSGPDGGSSLRNRRRTLDFRAFSRYATHSVRVPDLRQEEPTVATLLRIGRSLNLQGWVLFSHSRRNCRRLGSQSLDPFPSIPGARP